MHRASPSPQSWTAGRADPALSRAVRFLALGIVLLAAPGRIGAEEPDPWPILERAKAQLVAAGPSSYAFDQTLIPAGFTGGDTESGTLYLDLPRCLRWDYRNPYPRSFLVCGALGYFWNEGEPVGRRFFVTEGEPGLDLLLLDRSALENRYRASAATDGTGIEIRLEPRSDESGELVEARFVFAGEDLHLSGFAFLDREGNRTRFTLRPLGKLDGKSSFEPPAGIAWAEE